MAREFLLVNETDFSQAWAKEHLKDRICADMSVLLLPLSYNEGWASDELDWKDKFEGTKTHFDELSRPFLSYGISTKKIHWLNYYDFDFEFAKKQMRKCDILVIISEDACDAMEQIDALELSDLISSFDGLIIGMSAGAKILQSDFFSPLSEFNSTFQYYDGLGLLSGFDLDMNYVENKYHVRNIIHSLEEHTNSVVVLPKNSALFIAEDHIDLLGQAFIADDRDLDELYGLLDTFE